MSNEIKEAIKNLLDYYKSDVKDLPQCYLCVAVGTQGLSTLCKNCPWVIFEGHTCDVGFNIFTKTYHKYYEFNITHCRKNKPKEWVDYRIKQLENWK